MRYLFAIWLLSCIALVATPAAAPAAWIGPQGEPLPFISADDVVDFLRTADVIAQKELSSGINGSLKLTLEQDGIQAHAIFRTVDIDTMATGAKGRHTGNIRDSYIFEVAAYELSRLLGIDNVPPATLRRLQGRRGSVQLWVEEAMTEATRVKTKSRPENLRHWQLQKQRMVVFDNLIYNFDRNSGNMLIDQQGKLWFVDHTRSFKQLPALPSPLRIVTCDRQLYEGLSQLDPTETRRTLRSYLRPSEISALLKRARLVEDRLAALIAEKGTSEVVFEFDALLSR